MNDWLICTIYKIFCLCFYAGTGHHVVIAWLEVTGDVSLRDAIILATRILFSSRVKERKQRWPSMFFEKIIIYKTPEKKHFNLPPPL